jgi:hypothetical protein
LHSSQDLLTDSDDQIPIAIDLRATTGREDTSGGVFGDHGWAIDGVARGEFVASIDPCGPELAIEAD